jgi:23S rRNA pseudouridine955/2504/2580 synthase
MSTQDRPAKARILAIGAEEAGQRLDNFLFKTCKGVPRTRVYRVVRRGEVRVNMGRARPDYRLQEGDRLRIPPLRVAPESLARPRVPPIMPEIVFEDEWLLALNKPPGLAVHGGSGISAGLIESLRAARPHCRFLELVHRLDRDTSGVLLIAKKRAALVALHEGLRQTSQKAHRFQKRYLALVQGAWPDRLHEISAPLRKGKAGDGTRQVAVHGEGRYAKSLFRVVERFGVLATLVEIRLLTGRTHQARVHAAHAGHPIAGDDKYGDWDWNARLRKVGLRRMFLHAAGFHLPHPETGAPLDLQAPLPADLEKFLNALRKEPADQA